MSNTGPVHRSVIVWVRNGRCGSTEYDDRNEEEIEKARYKTDTEWEMSCDSTIQSASGGGVE